MTDTRSIIAAQRQTRAIARGKPHLRDAALTAIGYLRVIARGHGTPSMYAALAEKIEMLKDR